MSFQRYATHLGRGLHRVACSARLDQNKDKGEGGGQSGSGTLAEGAGAGVGGRVGGWRRGRVGEGGGGG